MRLEKDRSVNEEKLSKEARGDVIQRLIGGFGLYQLGLCLITQSFKYFVAFHQLGIIFLAPKVSYTCGVNGTETCPCSEPIYDTSIFSNTIVMEWDLICDRKWMISFTQTILNLGILVGSIIFGMAADRFGRKNPLIAAVVIQLVAAVAAAYAPDYWTFTFLRFIVGATVGGALVTSFVIVMEFVGTEYRETVSSLYHIPFNIGHTIMPLFGYFLRDYSSFQLGVSLPGVLLLSYFFLVPETPRWLIAAKKTDKAIHILERVAKWNKQPTDNIRTEVIAYQATIKQNQIKKGNLLDVFRTPVLRINIIGMCLNWMAGAYTYTGISQYVGQLSGNLFINVAATGAVTVVGSLVSLPLLRVFGRRTLVIVFNLMCAACMLIMAVIPEGVVSVALAIFGIVCSLITFIVLYLYCVELFPTVVRNAALGFTSMCARVGAMVAPFVIDLQDVARWLPPVVFALLPLIAGCVTFLLPETKGRELTDTLEEEEQSVKKINK